MLTVRSRLVIKAGILKNKTKTQDVKMKTRSRIKNLTNAYCQKATNSVKALKAKRES